MPSLLRRAFLLTLALVPLAGAALEWKQTKVSLAALPLQRTVETRFDFTNTSAQTVTIRRVDTSCDCLEATPSASTFAPGESGHITALFTVGDRVGKIRRTILVSTDEGGERTSLTADLEIPEIATLTPRSTVWKLNATPASQAVEIVVTPGIDVTIDQVQATSAAFRHRLETVTPGRHYRLHLEPVSTAGIANAAFRLHGKAAGGEDVVLSAYANVR